MPPTGRDFRSRPRGARASGRAGRDTRKIGARKVQLSPFRSERVILYGWHTVTAALRNPRRRIRRLLLTRNAARRLEAEQITLPVATEVVSPEEIVSQLPDDAVHQGVFAEADPLPSPPLEELRFLKTVLALDHITDPHNVGAILRSAAAFAAGAVLMTGRHSPEATGALAKAASGALEYVPIVVIPNLARALDTLKNQGFLIVGLDGSSPVELGSRPLTSPLALVLGAEDRGLRQLTRTTCHALARLELPGAIRSLNVSNAAAIALYIVGTKLRSLPS